MKTASLCSLRYLLCKTASSFRCRKVWVMRGLFTGETEKTQILGVLSTTLIPIICAFFATCGSGFWKRGARPPRAQQIAPRDLHLRT